jgi:hypothetical protein
LRLIVEWLVLRKSNNISNDETQNIASLHRSGGLTQIPPYGRNDNRPKTQQAAPETGAACCFLMFSDFTVRRKRLPAPSTTSAKSDESG